MEIGSCAILQSLTPYFAASFTVKSNSLLGNFPQNLISLEVFSQKTQIQAHASSFLEKSLKKYYEKS